MRFGRVVCLRYDCSNGKHTKKLRELQRKSEKKFKLNLSMVHRVCIHVSHIHINNFFKFTINCILIKRVWRRCHDNRNRNVLINYTNLIRVRETTKKRHIIKSYPTFYLPENSGHCLIMKKRLSIIQMFDNWNTYTTTPYFGYHFYIYHLLNNREGWCGSITVMWMKQRFFLMKEFSLKHRRRRSISLYSSASVCL